MYCMRLIAVCVAIGMGANTGAIAATNPNRLGVPCTVVDLNPSQNVTMERSRVLTIVPIIATMVFEKVLSYCLLFMADTPYESGIKSDAVDSKSRARFKYRWVVATLACPSKVDICVIGIP